MKNITIKSITREELAQVVDSTVKIPSELREAIALHLSFERGAVRRTEELEKGAHKGNFITHRHCQKQSG